jgi:membrane-associated phospholipid phosphatase
LWYLGYLWCLRLLIYLLLVRPWRTAKPSINTTETGIGRWEIRPKIILLLRLLIHLRLLLLLLIRPWRTPKVVKATVNTTAKATTKAKIIGEVKITKI